MNGDVTVSNTTNLINISFEGLDKLAKTFADIAGNALDFSLPQTLYERKQRRIHENKLSEAKTNFEILDLKDDYEKQLAKKAIGRMILEEMQNLENFEGIAYNSLKYIPKKVTDQPVNKTWARQFFDKSKIVSDEDIKEYWSKVLAEEVSIPGSISLKTLSILETLNKSDLELFSSIAKFTIDGVINFYDSELWVRLLNINYSKISHLQFLGLMDFSPFLQSRIIIDSNNFDSIHWPLILNNKITFFKFKSIGEKLIPVITLTQAGIELLRFVNISFTQEYFDLCITKFKNLYPQDEVYSAQLLETYEENGLKQYRYNEIYLL